MSIAKLIMMVDELWKINNIFNLNNTMGVLCDGNNNIIKCYSNFRDGQILLSLHVIIIQKRQKKKLKRKIEIV